MNLLVITAGTAAVLSLAYVTVGRWLARRLELSRDAVTPACQINDGVDYVPTPAPYLFSQHFSAIAAAGPIVGPIAAGLIFGWGPALVWILVGSIFVGGVHDMGSLIASVRHKAGSIAEIVREHMSRRAYLLFLSFVWIALVYIVVAFTDLTATTFAPQVPAPLPAGATEAQTQAYRQAMADVEQGKAVASSSMIYLALAVVMGLALRFTRLPLGWATVIFLPLVLVSIWAGDRLPLGIPEWMWWNGSAAKTWDILLLLYCGVASVVPVWALLQPRGYLGGYFLSVTVALAFLGIICAAAMGNLPGIEYPAFRGDTSAGLSGLLSVTDASGAVFWVFPVLFVTIACGACSGFHSMISSGTSSKQLKSEYDAKSIGYGAMLLEAFVAVISLACVMILKDGQQGNPDKLFAQGMSRFIAFASSALGVEQQAAQTFLYKFALLAFATFIYDTLDVCTRLGRYVLQEFTGWPGNFGRVACTVATLLPPLFLVLQTMTTTNALGEQVPMPAWKMFWTLFGTANQLLAALTLIGITVWLVRTGKSWWYTALPAVFMAAVTFTSLAMIVWTWAGKAASALRETAPAGASWFDINGVLSSILLVLAACLVVEAIVVLRRTFLARDPRRSLGS